MAPFFNRSSNQASQIPVGELGKIEEENWFENDYEEGQLSIDVFQTETNLVIKSTIAGAKSEDLDIAVNNDMLTIRGSRQMDEQVSPNDFLYRECYWGPFSRSIILPMDILANKIEAFLENGVLTVILPKAPVQPQVSINVKDL
ncbi:MAG: Hsp20/alpha crystallin family protein [Candidatus Falkowbacteria bacterium]